MRQVKWNPINKGRNITQAGSAKQSANLEKVNPHIEGEQFSGSNTKETRNHDAPGVTDFQAIGARSGKALGLKQSLAWGHLYRQRSQLHDMGTGNRPQHERQWLRQQSTGRALRSWNIWTSECKQGIACWTRSIPFFPSKRRCIQTNSLWWIVPNPRPAQMQIKPL